MLSSEEILKKYLEFQKNQHHSLIPNLSLIPENDPTLLFVNSGMFPLVPYLSGEPHPEGRRLTNVQRSMRFEDIEEIGDSRHTTVFHMLGNWSLGDYFKKEQLLWIYELLIEKLGLDPKRLFATVFAGDERAPKDTESINILKAIFKKYGIEAKENEQIFLGTKDNWWQRGEAIGELGGPDSEIFYYIGKGEAPLGKNPGKFEEEFLEIGNSVFMQYRRTQAGWEELPQKNVDFGGGLERIAMVVQQKADIFETDNFWPIISDFENLSGLKYHQDQESKRSLRILADHARAATLLAMDGVTPANKDQGYALRRFLRRLIRFGTKIGLTNFTQNIPASVVKSLGWLYPELQKQAPEIASLFKTEEERFAKTLNNAQKQVKQSLVNLKNTPEDIAKTAFNLYQSSGFPPEMFVDEVIEKGIKISLKEFERAYKSFVTKHQALSRKGAEQKFKGGLADHSEMVIKYHTATHLLHQALRTVIGETVQQQGSNITGERLRFDFAHSHALSDSEVKAVEKLVNQTISQKLPVNFVMLKKTEAEKSGALHFFKEKYPETVKVYYVGNSIKEAFSKEFCGGPHVRSLAELPPTLTIYKQESVGGNLRRIYAKFN